MDEALRNGRIRILDRCAGGWAYLAGSGRIRQVVYTILEQNSDIDMEVFLKTLSDTRERFPVINQFLLQIGNEYYYARYEDAREDFLYTKERVIGGEENGFHSFDISVDKNRILLSTDHALMDGSGLMEVTDFFCGRYAFYKGDLPCESQLSEPMTEPKDIDPFSLPWEEGYKPVSGFEKSAFMPAFQEDLSSLFELILPTTQVLSLCKSLSASPVVLFALFLSDALAQVRENEKGGVVVSIPVNYRDVLDLGSRMRVCAFLATVDLSEEKWSGLSFREKAKKLRAYLRERRDPAFAGGWIRFFKDYIIPMNAFRSSRGTVTGEESAYSFMLSYLRPAGQNTYRGKHLIYSGISVPNDFCLLEYDGNFHLWLRPFCNERIIPAFQELCTRSGLKVKGRRTEGASFISRPPKLDRSQLPPYVFVFVSPAYGHVNPLLPLVRELVNRGYAVRVYTGSEMREKVEETGAVCISFDVYYAAGKSPEHKAYGFLRMLELAQSMDETAGADVVTFQPRFAIVDTMSVWGRLLAEKHGLRIVLSCATRIMNRSAIPDDFGDFFTKLRNCEEEITGMLKHLSDKGFKRHTIQSLLMPGTDTDCIAYIPKELQGDMQAVNTDRVFFAGYSHDPMCSEPMTKDTASAADSEARPAADSEARPAADSGIRSAADEESALQEKKRPLIYVTMGTVASQSPWFFRSAAAAFRSMDVDVVMAVWNHIDIGMLGKIPDNIRVFRKVDQAEILKKADAALFHAGLNTIRDCLLCGVPMVVCPTVSDQFGNARMVEDTGVGIRLEDHKPDTIRKAVALVLAEPAFRRKAKALGERMRSMGGAGGAAAWICERMNYEAAYPFSPGMKQYYNMSGDKVWLCANLVYLFKKTDPEELRIRYKKLIDNRQMLRAFPVFPVQGEPYLAVREPDASKTAGSTDHQPGADDGFFFMDLCSLKDAVSQKKYIRAFLDDFQRNGFEPERPAFRAGLVKIGQNRFMLFMIGSHYLLDAMGVQRVVEDLIGTHELYDDAKEVKRFYDTCAALAERPETSAYWERLLKGVKGYTQLPFLITSGKKARVICEKTPIPKKPVEAFARRHHATLPSVIYAALGEAILKLTGLKEVCFITTVNRRNEYLTTDSELTGMYAVETPFVYRRGDTPETCSMQFFDHRQYIMYDFCRLGEGFDSWGTPPGVIRCNINSSYIVKGTLPDDFFLAEYEYEYENGAEEHFRGVEFFVVPADMLYLNMVYNERFISGEAANALKTCLIETLNSYIK